MATTISAHTHFNRNPRWAFLGPPRAAIRLMLDEIEAAAARMGCAPVALSCEVWADAAKAADGYAQVARITVTVEPGDMTRSLASWFEWQHPHWALKGLPLAIEGVRGAIAQASS